MEKVAVWLEQIGMSQFHEKFDENGIDFELLHGISNDDLKDIGVTRLVDRKLLLREIEVLSIEVARTQVQRRLLSVLFCDLVGSTALSTEMDPEELRRELKQYQDTVVNAVTQHGGFVARFTGDGVLAYFGWPHADEDQAAQAARAAINARARVNQLEFESGATAHCRIGIATGHVVVGGQEDLDSAFGETPNLAARLQSYADEDQIVIDSITQRAMGKNFDCEFLKSEIFKGFDRPIDAWAVVRECKYVDRFESRKSIDSNFIGRNDEMTRIATLWQEVRAGEGQTVLIHGEAGIGKSRLVNEFCNSIPAAEVEILRYQCSAQHTNSAFYPAIRRMEEGSQIDPHRDSASEKMRKIRNLFDQSIADDATAMNIIAGLLSIAMEGAAEFIEMPAQERRAKAIEILIENAMRKTRTAPLLLVIEDAHWIDPSSKQLLDTFVARTATAPIFIIITSRPDRMITLKAEDRVHEIAINRLDQAELAALTRSVDRSNQLAAEDVEKIASRADGIPLFAEEIAFSAIQHGYRGGEFELPQTIEASLTARLDNLGAEKETIQFASVLGREFSLSQIEALTDRSDEVIGQALSAGLASGLLQEMEQPSDRLYRFRHALIRDVAYNGLLRRQRKDLHRRVAAKVLDQNVRLQQPEIVAHHLTQAGQIMEAIDYWKKAGVRASGTSANAEAIAHFSMGLDLVQDLPENDLRTALEFSFQVGLASPLIAEKGYSSDELQQCITTALALSKRVSYTPEIYSLLYSQWSFLLTVGSMDASVSVAIEFSDLAERQNDEVALYARYRMLGASHMCLGELRQAKEDLDKLITRYEPARHEKLASVYGVDLRVAGRCFQSEVLWLLGYVDQAAESASIAHREAKELNHLNSLAISLHFCGVVNFLRRDHTAVRNYMNEMMTLAKEHTIGAWPTLGGAMLGWSNLNEGDFDGQFEALCAGMRAARNLGVAMFIPIFTCRIAEVLMSKNRIDEAAQYLADTEALIDKTGEVAFKGEFLHLKGEYELRSGNLDQAQAHFIEAMELARAQQARSIELRAASSYAKCLARLGAPQQALDALAPISNWFTEGTKYGDLQKARSYIAELRQIIGE